MREEEEERRTATWRERGVIEDLVADARLTEVDELDLVEPIQRQVDRCELRLSRSYERERENKGNAKEKERTREEKGRREDLRSVR